jgi:hypothetical protein
MIEPKLYMNPTKNLIELKLYMNPTKNLIELSNTNHTKTWDEPLNRTEQHEPHTNMG